MPDAAPTVVDRIRSSVEQLPGIELAVLFGSQATGRATPASDVDLAVRLQPPGQELERDTELALVRAVPGADVVFFEAAPPQLRFEIARSGLLLVERQPGLWARERARALLDWWDWAPLARRIHAGAVARLRREAT